MKIKVAGIAQRLCVSDLQIGEIAVGTSASGDTDTIYMRVDAPEPLFVYFLPGNAGPRKVTNLNASIRLSPKGTEVITLIAD